MDQKEKRSLLVILPILMASTLNDFYHLPPVRTATIDAVRRFFFFNCRPFCLESLPAGPLVPVAESLVIVTNPPHVQMLITGFSVRRIDSRCGQHQQPHLRAGWTHFRALLRRKYFAAQGFSGRMAEENGQLFFQE